MKIDCLNVCSQPAISADKVDGLNRCPFIEASGRVCLRCQRRLEGYLTLSINESGNPLEGLRAIGDREGPEGGPQSLAGFSRLRVTERGQ